MKLIEKTWQSRRDFSGIYECEGCGHREEKRGCYDDDNFHINVVPNVFKCPVCGKTTKDLGLEPEKVATKYKPWEVV
jgi:predicted RNA-binding Zn-ribbon protein involved in translation (DUF1610 family)